MRRATDDPATLAGWVEQRVSGVPLEQLIGEVEFAGLRLAVGPGAFVPRRRTELLARLAAEAIEATEATTVEPRFPVVVELCCGVAAVAAVVAGRCPRATVYATDIDQTALPYARRNLSGSTAEVNAGDLYDALPPALLGRVDVLAANPPYVPSAEVRLMPPEARLHESLAALDGGADGLAVHRRILAAAPRWLSQTGCVFLEISRAQAEPVTELVAAAGLRPGVARDDELEATVVTGHRY